MKGTNVSLSKTKKFMIGLFIFAILALNFFVTPFTSLADFTTR